MKLVVTADVHIHPRRICSRDGGHDRLIDGLSVLRQSLDLARAEQAVWIMAGDFKEPKTFWPQSALTGAHAVLREYPDVSKIMLAGNHDAKGEGGTGLAPFKDVAVVIEEADVVRFGKFALRCLPWDAKPEELADTGLPLISHAFIEGVVLGPDDLHGGNGVALSRYGSFPWAVFGDIHKAQVFVGDSRWTPVADMAKYQYQWTFEAARVMYPGSPLMQNWGERNDGPKGVLVIDTDARTARLHELKAPRFAHIEADDAVLERLLPKLDQLAGDFVRVVYTGKGSMLLGALENQWAPTFRHFQLIKRKPVKSEKRTEIHAGLDRSVMIDRYLEARPPQINPAMTRAAMHRLFV